MIKSALSNLAGLICIFFVAGDISAQIDQDGRLSLDADYAVYKIPSDTSLTYFEIHYTLHRYQLRFMPADSGYIAYLDFHLDLRDSNGALLDSASWRAANVVQKLSFLDDTGYLIPDIIADMLTPGQYQADIDVNNGGLHGRISLDLDIPVFQNDKLELSSIELAYNIARDSSIAGKFTKNGLRVMPNPSALFASESKAMSIYAEGYGLNYSVDSDSNFTVNLDIIGQDSQFIQNLPPIVYKKPGRSAVIATSIPLDSIGAGDYYLKLTMTDGNSTASTTKKFSIVASRETVKRIMLSGIMQKYPEANNITTEENAAQFRDEITYIATRDEIQLYESLNLPGKAAFQKDFWARRDTDPSTPQNEFQIEHYKRFDYVETTFGKFRGGHAGWKTDMGRVYMLYGEPSEIERYPQAIDSRSWERWWYHGIEGGVYFVFIDYENATDYTLIHSSKNNELKDYNWEEKIHVGTLPR